MKRNAVIALFVAVGLLGVFTQVTQAYQFFAWEHSNLFLYDATDVVHKLSRIGGGALLAGSFLSQFMGLEYVGAGVMTLTYGFMAGMMWLMMNKVAGRGTDVSMLVPLALLPAVFMFVCAENRFFFFQGHMAMVLMMSALGVYVHVAGKNAYVRLLLGGVLGVMLYWLAGPVALVFVVSAWLYDWLRGLPKAWLTGFNLIIIIGVAVWSVRQLWVADAEHAFTPQLYYEGKSSYFVSLYIWVAVPLLFLLAGGMAHRPQLVKPVWRKWVCLAGFAWMLYLPYNLYVKTHSSAKYLLLQEERLATKGAWDELLQLAGRHPRLCFRSYTSLALAEKDRLLNGNIPWYDNVNLLTSEPKAQVTLSMLARIYLEWGCVADAMQAAFDANLVTPGNCNGEQLKILVDCNLALGAYEVAEKYIARLEHTLFYRDWAMERRKYLRNDILLEQEPLLGELRRSLPRENHFANQMGVLEKLDNVLKVNPGHRVAKQFRELYMQLLLIQF